MGVKNMDTRQLREIDNIYKQVTNNKIKTKVSVNDKITLIQMISGKKIKIQKTKNMEIPQIRFKAKTKEGLPNWMRR